MGLTIAVAALVLSGCGNADNSTPEAGDDLEELFDGAEVTIIVSQEPGDDGDVMARAVQAHIGQYLPAQPRIKVMNLPGGAHLRGHRELYQSEPDGLTISLYSNRWARFRLAGNEIPGYDPTKVRYLGTVSAGEKRTYYLCARPDTASTWEEALALDAPLKAGASSPGGGGSLTGELVDLLDGPIEMTFGYSGPADAVEAFNRGELTATTYCDSRYAADNPEWKEGEEPFPAVLAYMGETPDPAFLEELRWQAPPHLFDKLDLTDGQQNAIEALLALETLDSGLMLPPDTPDDVVQAWQEALADVVEDEEFAATIEAAGMVPGLGTEQQLLDAFEVIEGLPSEAEELFVSLTPEMKM